MKHTRLKSILDRFQDTSILVVGDYFLDKYLIVDPALTETSLETGLDAYQVVTRRCSPGAAGTVTSNLHALGVGTIYAIGVIGDDGDGYELKKGLSETNVITTGLIETPDRFTPTYTKPMIRTAEGIEEEIDRFDIKNRQLMSTDLEDQIIAQLQTLLPEIQGIIIADQVQERNNGVITDRVRQAIATLAQKHSDLTVLADSRAHIGAFRNVILKPNHHEAAQAINPSDESRKDQGRTEFCGQALFEKTGQPVYVTMSEKGMLLINNEGVTHIPGFPAAGKIDPVGAGDSTSAGIVSSCCAGATYYEAGYIGNLIASITVQKLGTTGTASPDEVLHRFEEVRG